MGNVNDNQYQINQLNSGDTFYDWVNKENNEIISKLNLLQVFDGASGQGISVSVGTTLGGGTSGVMEVSLLDSIPHGITFEDDVTINGTLNYDFGESEVTGTRMKFYGSGVSSYEEVPGSDTWMEYIQDVAGGTGFTFGMPVRLGRITKYSGTTGGTKGDWKFIDDGGTGDVGIFPAKADSKNHSEVIGLITGIELDHIEILLSGKLVANTTAQGESFKSLFRDTDSPYSDLGGPSGGCIYFLHAGATGALGYEPEIVGQVSKPVLTGLGETGGIFLPYRGQYLTSSTGDTGPGDTNRITIDLGSSSHDINVGQAVGYQPGFIPAVAGIWNDWFYCTDDVSGAYAVGICIKEITNQIIEISTSGYVNDFPTDGSGNSPEGLLYIGTDGYLTNNDPGVNVKPFASSWSVGGERKGTVLNQLGTYENALSSLLSGSTSGGSGLGENILINGGFDIWQRGIGVDSAYGVTGSTYFADRWVRVDGITSAGATGALSLQRMDFAGNQTSVEGNPSHYLRSYSGISGSTGDYVYIENRIEDVRTVRNEQLTLSFYAKSSIAGKTMGTVLTQNYDGINNQVITDINTGGFEITAAWKKFAKSFDAPEISTTPSGEHYVAIGFDMSNTGSASIDLAQVKLERGGSASSFVPINATDELEKCSRYYQRSYDKDDTTRTITMMGDCLPDLTVVDFIITPERDHYFKFPTQMRDVPVVSIYSPSTGTTGDGFNRSACKDVRLTSGSKGYLDNPRISPTGVDSFSTDSKKHGIRFYVKDGAVLFDSISLHYVADADLNGNL